MIGEALDQLIGVFAPAAAVRRSQVRRTLNRMYSGAEANRLTNNKKPKNQSADSELIGPFGADSLRAWSRALVRDNAYAWGVVDTIVSSVIGCGITAQSQVETPEGTDVEDVNEKRDKVWQEWCEVCDVNGRMNFAEIQQLAQREMVEAGEVLIHLVNTPAKKYRGIYRPVPLALELIEADRLATEKDTYKIRSRDGNKIIRGVELDELGKPLAYWIYPEHPNGPYATRVLPDRIDAKNILHLYRMDRIGQTRGAPWFAPVMSWLRDLGVYVDNEIQASAVASCFGVAITTTGRAGTGLMPSTDSEQSDVNGNQFEYLEPAMVVRLQPGESVESINPGRPNSASEPWINLMLRGISVGTGLSYEVVSRNYSGTSYSSSRTSMLEDRRRFRRWQKYMVGHMCQPIWDRFNDQAATAGVDGFASMSDILDDRRVATAVEWQTPAWEWVDPQSEQSASDSALTSFQSTYQDELGQRGKNWRNVFYQRAKEEKLKRQLGLVTADMAQVDATQAEGQQMAAASAVPPAGGAAAGQAPSGEMSDMSRMQWQRNRKAIEDILAEFITGTASEAKTKVFLQSLGLTEATASMLIDDASDGQVDTDLEEAPATERQAKKKLKRARDFVRDDDGQFASTPGGGGGDSGSEDDGDEENTTAKVDSPKLKQKKEAAKQKITQQHAEKTQAAHAEYDALEKKLRAPIEQAESDKQAALNELDERHGKEMQAIREERDKAIKSLDEQKAAGELSEEQYQKKVAKEDDKMFAAEDKVTPRMDREQAQLERLHNKPIEKMEKQAEKELAEAEKNLNKKIDEIDSERDDALDDVEAMEEDDDEPQAKADTGKSDGQQTVKKLKASDIEVSVNHKIKLKPERQIENTIKNHIAESGQTDAATIAEEIAFDVTSSSSMSSLEQKVVSSVEKQLKKQNADFDETHLGGDATTIDGVSAYEWASYEADRIGKQQAIEAVLPFVKKLLGDKNDT